MLQDLDLVDDKAVSDRTKTAQGGGGWSKGADEDGSYGPEDKGDEGGIFGAKGSGARDDSDDVHDADPDDLLDLMDAADSK